MTILPFIVLCTAIIVFFLQEWTQLGKAIFSIPGVKLFLPLIVASWLVIDFESHSGHWIIYHVHAWLHFKLQQLANLLPFLTYPLSMVQVMLLFSLALLPLLLAQWRNRRKSKWINHPWSFLERLSLVLWVILTFFLVVPV